MISPTAQDLLTGVIATLEDVLAPALTDEHAQSTCRTAAQLLRSAAVRIAGEQAALHADNADLRGLLGTWAFRLPAAAGEVVAQALADPPVPTLPALEVLEADARALRAALVAAIDSVPERDAPFRHDVRDYLARAHERQRPWLQDAFTGPKR